MASSEAITSDSLGALLADDQKVKLAGVDADGILRGKIVSKAKFLSIATTGFGFCSVVFGWDMHDMPYPRPLKVSNPANGFRDVLAVPDLNSFRRVPWENNIPFFLLRFFDPQTREPVSACPRGLLKKQTDRLRSHGYRAMAGAEYEFFAFRNPNGSQPTRFLLEKSTGQLPHLTEGMFGYSLTDPLHNQGWYDEIYDACVKMSCPLEGWHTECGPGVFEAALEYNEIAEMADRAAMFKLVAKSVGIKHGITPCFMAKPKQGLPGNSGHVHVSLVDESGRNLFARDTLDSNAPWKDIEGLSDLGRHFLAGILTSLPDIMPVFAPTINSYKRLVENAFAPVTVSWGLEHRGASVRLIAPPLAKPSATRLEIRVPGADSNPHYTLAAILGCGWRGVDKKLEIPIPPLSTGEQVGSEADQGERLANNLRDATATFMAPGSVAREVLGDEFVEHFGGTREHEIRLFDEAVTDWEMRRYIEMV